MFNNEMILADICEMISKNLDIENDDDLGLFHALQLYVRNRIRLYVNDSSWDIYPIYANSHLELLGVHVPSPSTTVFPQEKPVLDSSRGQVLSVLFIFKDGCIGIEENSENVSDFPDNTLQNMQSTLLDALNQSIRWNV